MSQGTVSVKTHASGQNGGKFKWIFTFILPFVVYYSFLFFEPSSDKIAMFFAVTLWAVSMWAFALMNDVIVALMLPVLYMVFCGTPPKILFNSWLGETPYILISGFILSRAMQETGLGKRIGLYCMKAANGSFMGALWGIMIASWIISALVPTLLGKAIIFCTILVAICEVLKLEKGSNAATALMLQRIFP